jgi:hypothetical protein
MEHTLEELKAIIKEERLGIVVKKSATPEEVFALIEAKRAVPSVEKKIAPSGAPSCFGEYVVSGSPKCRKCWFAKECK